MRRATKLSAFSSLSILNVTERCGQEPGYKCPVSVSEVLSFELNTMSFLLSTAARQVRPRIGGMMSSHIGGMMSPLIGGNMKISVRSIGSAAFVPDIPAPSPVQVGDMNAHQQTPEENSLVNHTMEESQVRLEDQANQWEKVFAVYDETGHDMGRIPPDTFFAVLFCIFCGMVVPQFALGKFRSNALELVHRVPIVEVDGDMAICDGGGGAMGHPLEYISLEVPGEVVYCKYCSVRYMKKVKK